MNLGDRIMFWIWLVIMILMVFNVLNKFNNISLAFLISSIISFILTFITKNYIILLCTFIIGGIILSFVLNMFLQKKK